MIPKVKKVIRIPFFAIGGINKENINDMLPLGIKKIAVCRAVCRAKNMTFTVKKFSKVLH